MKFKHAVVIAIIAVAGLALALGTSIARNAMNRDVKELVIIAKDMNFHLQGAEEEPITVRMGERIRLLMRNEEEEPITHNLVIVGLGLRTGYLKPGESETLEFVPSKTGTWLYACLLHPGLMEGQLKVLP